ncbi:twin-arginine translocation signal domain-containing protein [Rufibacter latericius]|nr:twin-arginine translocation signal domain-containing protein [Rufibacter latericius]
MEKNKCVQSGNKNPDASIRRNFLKAATLLGIGALAAGPVNSFATASREMEKKKGFGTILTKKRH